MAQSTITSYFSNRKRAAQDDFKMKSKVLVLDQSAVPLGYDANSTDNSPARPVTRKVVVARSKPANTQGHESKPTTRGTASRVNKNQSAKQPDLTNFFKKPEKSEETPKETEASTKPTVPFEMRGPLSPVKRRQEPAPVPAKSQEPQVAPTQVAQPKASAVEKARKELSLGEIKSRVTSRSSRMAELKERIARIERGEARLKELEKQASSPSPAPAPVRPDASPRLNKFHTIEIEVPASPTKCASPLTSPQKLLNSPRHPGLASPSKSPAFQRFASLAAPTDKVALPFGYRVLAELFRCVDWSVSMMHNRTETVTFAKLKPCVQEMCRKTFTERHFAQIKTVLPNAFAASQVKMKSFGSMAKEKYELVVVPLIKSDSGAVKAEPGQMTPALLAERQQDFYKSLVEIVREHHDVFLRSLEPPMVVARERVTRWHAAFPLDAVPEVTPAELPVAPGQEKVSSAKDVLAHARHLFTVNPRMGKALEKVAAATGEGPTGTTVKVEVVDADTSTPATPPPAPAPTAAPAAPTKPNIASALKGLPKALLEKIRAKQAAKALEAMTRSPAQDKEAVQYSRLPEIARIVRNCYVVEKKGVMPLEIVVEKVANSYRTTISRGELEEHLRLMAKEVPGWITFDTLRNTDFLRLSKNADMNKVLKKLESLAVQKTGFSA